MNDLIKQSFRVPRPVVDPKATVPINVPKDTSTPSGINNTKQKPSNH
jgi:hypothetical protein